jgi:hypothetical protein
MADRRTIRTACITAAALVAVVLIGDTVVTDGMPRLHVKTADVIARQVGRYYGDMHPRIVDVESTRTDNPPHDRMYYITLAGHFHEGRRAAHYVGFSALADRIYVWGVMGYNHPGSMLWFDDELEPLPK